MGARGDDRVVVARSLASARAPSDRACETARRAAKLRAVTLPAMLLLAVLAPSDDGIELRWDAPPRCPDVDDAPGVNPAEARETAAPQVRRSITRRSTS